MNWLSGKPGITITLTWPEDDSIIQLEIGNSYAIGKFSILDDQVLRFFIYKQSTSIYLAKLYEAVSNRAASIAFVKIATLPYAVHRISLLPNKVGFASLNFIKQCVDCSINI